MPVEDSIHRSLKVCGDLHKCEKKSVEISNGIDHVHFYCNLNCNPGHLVVLLDEAQ